VPDVDLRSPASPRKSCTAAVDKGLRFKIGPGRVSAKPRPSTRVAVHLIAE
jgi:hypothetical protein